MMVERCKLNEQNVVEHRSIHPECAESPWFVLHTISLLSAKPSQAH